MPDTGANNNQRVTNARLALMLEHNGEKLDDYAARAEKCHADHEARLRTLEERQIELRGELRHRMHVIGAVNGIASAGFASLAALFGK